MHRFVEFGLRVGEIRNGNDVKVGNWLFVLDKLSKLKKNKIVLMAYRIMLEDLKGRMKSLTILDTDAQTFTVANRTTGEKKSITVPRCTSLWKLRHVIGEEFNLPNLNFEMMTLGSRSYKDCDFEREEDFSIMIITFNKEQVPVVISHNKMVKHPHLEALDKFYNAMSDSRGEELVEMLSREEGEGAL